MALHVPSSPAPAMDDLDDRTFKNIADYVYRHARISLGESKRELVRARLAKAIRQRGMPGYKAYYEWLANDRTGEAAREIMNAISTNLTSFFRENKHFEFLAQTLLPEFARSGQRTLRGWSAGCSTGQEIYTIAMTLFENLPDAGAGLDLKLLATDIDTEVVQTGARGLYGADAAKGIPPPYLKKYFDRTVDAKGRPAHQASDRLRRLITFRNLNLFDDWPFKRRFTFIFCRNVMIYFDRPTQEQLVNRYLNQLDPGGHLFIGHSESLNGIRHGFEYVLPTIYRRPLK